MKYLTVKNLTKSFGGIKALDTLSFEVAKGEIVSLIGPNGAGKTTTFNLISGFYEPSAGEIIFKGQNITGLQPFEICSKGIARTFQIVKPFLTFTALQNVMIGTFRQTKDPIEAEQYAMEVIEFLDLKQIKDKLASGLTLLERKSLELARALGTGCEMLLLDEVMAGLNSTEISVVMRKIINLREVRGLTILLVEHVMKAVMGLSDKIIVLNYGQKIAEGDSGQIANDKRVIEAYLGI
jgi:branched-chain amino acid transport system ATP-binding protein